MKRSFRTAAGDGGRPDVCIVGLGLIGASLGVAWRRSGAVGRLTGVDPDARARAVAVARAAVEQAEPDLPATLPQADVIVLAAPVDAVLDMAEAVVTAARPGAIITDVCSVKRPIVERYQRALRQKDGVAFVGGHPMAGSERQGAEAADPLLFENAAYVLTPTPETDAAAVAAVEALVRALGAHPVRLDPEAHDRAVAAASHLPQLVATALMLTVGRQRIEAGSGAISPVALAGGGLRDTTRIAASPARLWRDILLTNADEILRQLDRFEETLAALRRALGAGDGAALTALFDEAARLRAGVRARQRELLPRWPELSVRLADRPGALADVTGVLARAGLNIADIEIVRTREGDPGAVRIALAGDGDVQVAAQVLREAGFEVNIR
ncbi:MAG TPA: prephenate dehydrogenase [Bacillota bacterium]